MTGRLGWLNFRQCREGLVKNCTEVCRGVFSEQLHNAECYQHMNEHPYRPPACNIALRYDNGAPGADDQC